MSERLYADDFLAADEQRCHICPEVTRKTELERIQLDAPGNWQEVCGSCYQSLMDAMDDARLEALYSQEPTDGRSEGSGI